MTSVDTERRFNSSLTIAPRNISELVLLFSIGCDILSLHTGVEAVRGKLIGLE